MLHIGIFGKTHGVGGNIYLHLNVLNPDKKEAPKAVYLQSAGTYLPHFITHWESISDKKAIVRLEGFGNREIAMNLTSCNAYCEEAIFAECFETIQKPGEEFIGLTVSDSSVGEIGMVEEVLNLNSNILLVIKSERGEILIPLADAYIDQIDSKRKTLFMNLPDGLVDLNIQSLANEN